MKLILSILIGIVMIAPFVNGCDPDSGDFSGPCDSENPPAGCEQDCSTGEPCPSGFYCGVDGVCTADCTSNTDCLDGERCNENGLCVEEQTSDGSCSSNEDCSGSLICHPFSQRCVSPGEACSAHSDCPNEMYCDPTLDICLEGMTGSPCDGDENCDGACVGGVCGCDALVYEQSLEGAPLDIYLIFDRTRSMGEDCDYTPGGEPRVDSKACFATYAMCDYLINVSPVVDTRLAFQFMSLGDDDCDGEPYETPLIDLTSLPVSSDHALVRAISDENFTPDQRGTHIEGALRGLAAYTAAHVTPGREIIGVLMTDGDAHGCEEDISALRSIVADHSAATGIRTFIIGMEGATEENLETIASGGGADPHDDWCGGISAPCHYWNVGDGSGDAIESALQAIIEMSVPLPCSFDIASLNPPEGEELDFGMVNVTLTEGGTVTTIGNVSSAAECPSDVPAWYYDDPSAPTEIRLCPYACDIVSASDDGSRVDIVVGCEDTVTLY